jgi:carbon monoxide dehydrogenase subunit G
MSKMKLSIGIDAAPEAVFDMIADIENSAERIEGIQKIEMLTEGPVGVGTKWRETRLMMKKEAVEEMEISAFERPTHYTVYCDSCGCDMDWTMRVEPSGDGSTLALDMTSKARTLTAKLMAPLGWLMSGMMKKCVVKDLENIKAYIEKAGARTPVGD